MVELLSYRKVIETCLLFLQSNILLQCRKVNLPLAAKGKIINFEPEKYKPGKLHFYCISDHHLSSTPLGHPHKFEVECDILPPVIYNSSLMYKSLDITMIKTESHLEGLQGMKLAMCEKHREFIPAPSERGLEIEDGAVISVDGYLVDPNGRGKATHIKHAKNLKILMQQGCLVPGLLEGLIGAKAGDVRTVLVKFPSNSSLVEPANSDAKGLHCDTIHMSLNDLRFM